MGQDAFCQSDCSIFKRTKSPEQIIETAWCVACWYQFKIIIIIIIKIKEIDHFLVGDGQRWMWPIWLRDSKLNGSQEGAVGINWFFAWCYKFRRAKSCFNDFRVAVTF